MDVRPNPQRRAQPPQRQPGLVVPPRSTPLTVPPATAPLIAISPEPTPSQTSPGLSLPPKKSRKKWWIIGGILGVIAGIVVAIAGSVLWYRTALEPRSADQTPVTIDIQPGATIDDVAAELEQKKVIKSALAFSLYTKLNGAATIKTGAYIVAANQSVPQIAEIIHGGHITTRKVTILPGKTLKQIREGFIQDGFAAEAVDAALKKQYERPLLAGKPADASLEGYIFPETYFVTMDATPETLLERTFGEFEKRLETDGLQSKLEARGFTLYQAITLASIIGKEVADPEEQKQVSQVFQTRLTRNMVLGSDPTYQYAADMLGVPRAVNLDSPYNTRINKGLPPGPIANFNLSALVAVAEPAQGDYLYFVSGDDGVTRFSRTFEEHEENIQKYCQKLCAQP